ncbi:MAG: hypothetical protein KAS82_02750 [Bacteroidales bacterium]|nr:hypothetical protein [Bacteroidales bacterium]
MIVEKIPAQSKAPVKAEHTISNQNWVEAPQVNVAFSIKHDGSSIYLYYQVEEPQVRAVNTGFNSPVWEDSCVEFFHFSTLDTLSGLDAHANFYKCGDKLKQPHFLSWKPVLCSTPDFHTPRYFGQLSFL